MIGTLAFSLHLIGFGILSATIVGGWILDRKLRAQSDLPSKLLVGSISKSIELLSPIAAILLLGSGIANIFFRYADPLGQWFSEGWLVFKLILFVVLLLNGMVFGPKLIRTRLKIVQSKEADQSRLHAINNQITLFYITQTLFVLIILLVSLLGTAKHMNYQL